MDEDRVIKTLIEHGERLGKLVTKDEFNVFKNQVLGTQDEMLTILRRLDEERVFTTAWLNRIEKEVEEHKKEIGKIKEHLKIS